MAEKGVSVWHLIETIYKSGRESLLVRCAEADVTPGKCSIRGVADAAFCQGPLSSLSG